MKRRIRAFSIAESLVAGFASVIVGGVAVASFVGFGTARTLASNRDDRTMDSYLTIQRMRTDIQRGKSFELVSATQLKVTEEVNDVDVVTDYRFNSTSKRIERRIGDAASPDMTFPNVNAFEFEKVSDGCVRFTLDTVEQPTARRIRYVGEVMLRNWVKK